MRKLITGFLICAVLTPALSNADTGTARDLTPAEHTQLLDILLGQYRHLPGGEKIDSCVAQIKKLKLKNGLGQPAVVSTGRENPGEDDTIFSFGASTVDGKYARISFMAGEGTVDCEVDVL